MGYCNKSQDQAWMINKEREYKSQDLEAFTREERIVVFSLADLGKQVNSNWKIVWLSEFSILSILFR